jgi:hypothetical protein
MFDRDSALPAYPRRMLCLATTAMFFSQIAVAIGSFYIGVSVGKWTILTSYGLYLLAFALSVHAERRRMIPSRTGIVMLFGLFMTVILGSALVTAIYEPSTALLRNICYLLAFGVVPFLLGAAQDRRTLEMLMSTAFYSGLAVALITLAPTSWTYDAAGYGRPIFLGADALRLLLGLVLGIATLAGFYYAITARGKALRVVTLACSAVMFLSLYFSVMRMAYYLAFLLLMFMPVHLMLCKRISVRQTILFVGIAVGLHLLCTNILIGISFMLGILGTEGVSPDAYYGLLSRSHLRELDWNAIVQQFSLGQLPLIKGQSAIGLTDMFDSYPNDSTVIRVRLYLEAMMMFFAAPILGIGASNFHSFSSQGPFSFPHSTLLHVAAELGSVGLLLFVPLLALSMWRMLPYTLLLAPYIFFFVLDQTHGSYFTSWGSYFFMGVATSLMCSTRHEYSHADQADFQLLRPCWENRKL